MTATSSSKLVEPSSAACIDWPSRTRLAWHEPLREHNHDNKQDQDDVAPAANAKLLRRRRPRFVSRKVPVQQVEGHQQQTRHDEQRRCQVQRGQKNGTPCSSPR